MIDETLFKLAMIENTVTMACCVACVTALAAYTDGQWGWGFLLLLNINGSRSYRRD